MNPIAIGGLGGSGTRVFAACLQHAGISIGPALNSSLDNLWFTALFKRAVWARNIPDPADIAVSVDLFHRAMTCGLTQRLTQQESALLEQLSADLPPNGSWHCGVGAADVVSLMASGEQERPWGWKEPNTHLFLPQLNQHLSGLRYIHVMRNGLDMAFSKNTWQADNWSHHYYLNRAADDPAPLHQLRYWIAANRRALDYGRHHMPGRFLTMDYDVFCASPDRYWPVLQRFIGQPADTPVPDGLIAPSTIGRGLTQDLSIFPANVLDAARTLQFEVEQLTKTD